jgi:hypothetical protein
MFTDDTPEASGEVGGSAGGVVASGCTDDHVVTRDEVQQRHARVGHFDGFAR